MRRVRKYNRLQKYDYSQNGMYYVTICTHDKKCYFGKIEDDKMVLNEFGKIVEKFWLEIPKHYQNVIIDEFIIMPNHIHGIIIIKCDHDIVVKNTVVTEQCSVTTMKNGKTVNYGLLSKIIMSYKNIITKVVRNKSNSHNFQWQRSYYDHVIRNEQSLEKVREYILFNSSNWKKDKFKIESIDKKLI